VLENLERLGVRLCLDGFGMGHSSQSTLSRFPFDVVKLDGSVTTPALGDAGQVFLLALPAPADEITAWLASRKR
jgi:sensor c-di-GMP phosphodiesterase-like protein